MATNLYAILGLPTDADAAAIKKAYRGKYMQWHPDKNSSDEAQERFKDVETTKEILTDPQLKAEYDRFLPYGHEAALNAANNLRDALMEEQQAQDEAEELATEQAAAHKTRIEAMQEQQERDKTAEQTVARAAAMQEERDETAELAAQGMRTAQAEQPSYSLPKAFRTPNSPYGSYASFFRSPLSLHQLVRLVVEITRNGSFLFTNQAPNTISPNTPAFQTEPNAEENDNASPFRAQPTTPAPAPTAAPSNQAANKMTNLGFIPTQPLEELRTMLTEQYSSNDQHALLCSLNEKNDETTLTIQFPPDATEEDVVGLFRFLTLVQLVEREIHANYSAALNPNREEEASDQKVEEEVSVGPGF